MKKINRWLSAFGAAVALALLAGCGGQTPGDDGEHASGPSPAPASKKNSTTVGFVVTRFVNAFYSSAMSEDCPEGYVIGTRLDDLLAKLPLAERQRLQRRENLQELRAVVGARGPQRLNICQHPASVPDPGMRTIRGRMAYGLDLDGDAGAAPTAASCGQQDFVSPRGEPGIDHQYYRVLGCTKPLRSKEGEGGELGNLAATYEQLYVESGHAILLELAEVDDLVNDEDVAVGIYMSPSGVIKGTDGKALPYASMSVDANPYWQSRTRGRIVDGVLTTDPVDVHFKDFILRPPGLTLYKQARLRLTIDPNTGTAKGLLGAYHDVQQVFANILAPPVEQFNGFACEGLYYALKRFADGLPDPESGECTGISVAYHVEAIPAMVISADAVSEAERQSAARKEVGHEAT